MIPHSLIFSFILAHFGLRQNPTGPQEAIKRSDENSKTTLIIKSTLERSFLMKITKKIIFGILRFSPDSTYILMANPNPRENVKNHKQLIGCDGACGQEGTRNERLCTRLGLLLGLE